MDEEQKRQLEEWIAQHVFGWRYWRFKLPNGIEWCQLVSPADRWPELKKEKWGCVRLDAKPEGIPDESRGSVPLYTSAPEATLFVLQKLASTTAITIYQGETTGKWYVETWPGNTNDPQFSEWAETLPLAICKAAKAYFEFHGAK